MFHSNDFSCLANEMNVDDFIKGLSEQHQLAVIKFALPGVHEFLEDILAAENLSEKGENLRLEFVSILKNLGSAPQSDEINTVTSNDKESPQQHSLLLRSDDDLVFNKGYSHDNTEQAHWPEETAEPDEKESEEILPCHKRTDSTEERGIFLCSTSLPQSDATSHKDTLKVPILDSVDAWSRDTIISETSSAEVEVLDGWESDVNGHEEGYFTGDNVFVDYSVQTLDLQPNEFGELHSGVMYIREHPGWHKRWFSINDQCLTCFRHRSETKMLFQIPLKGAKIIPTDRKKSRMFPITLSVPRIHETITFATTEDHSRQEWVYVINYVLSRLLEDDSSPDSPENQPAISYDTYLKLTKSEKDPNKSNPCAEELEKQNQTRRRKVSVCLEGTRISEPCRSGSDNNDNVVTGSLSPWKMSGVEEDEEEMHVMNNDLSPGLDDVESFRELQEILPDIIQGCEVSPEGRKKKKSIFKTYSSNNVNKVDHQDGSFLSVSSCEGKSLSVSDLQSPGSKVKRHGSLADSLSSKASRVKSRITGSFFKKGRKDDIKTPRELTSSQSTTFSGYLLRKKGMNWKNRWCVVKELSLFCYKDFGIGTAELQVPLRGASVKPVIEGTEPDDKQHVFVLMGEKEELLFAAENDAEQEEWIMVLNDEIKSIENFPSPVSDSPEKTPGMSPRSLSNRSIPGSSSLPESKELVKESKDSSPFSTKKTSLFSSIGHKLTKSKPKAVPVGELAVPASDVTTVGSVEGGFIFVQHGNDSGSSTVERRSNKSCTLEVTTSHTMEGFLNQRVEDDTWLKCWVKLENHTLHIHDDKDSEDSVVVKLKLSNCVVKDRGDQQRPFVMEIRRALGRTHFLQAQSESEYNEWKKVISGSIVNSPKNPRRPVLTWSSTDEDRTHRGLLGKTQGDSIDRDDVFQKTEEAPTSPTGHPVRPNTPLNPSPRPSTAGDVSNSESDESESAARNEPLQPEPVERWRSFSEGEQEEERKTRSKLHRSISNAIPAIAHFPGKRKRRSRTVPNVQVSQELIANVKHSSCLFMRSGKGLWTKRWCVLQKDKLHLFRRPDEMVPTRSIPLRQCEVRCGSKKTKKFSFELNVPSEKEDLCFAADSEKEMLSWMRLLRVVAEEADAIESSKRERSDVVNVETEHKSRDVGQTSSFCATDQSPADIYQKNDEIQETSSNSPLGSQKIEETLSTNSPSEGLPKPSTFACRPTSLDGVLKLLQDQQLMQQIGQQRFDKVKKAQKAWQRSAAAALKERRSASITPDGVMSEPTSGEAAIDETKRRTLSLSRTQGANTEISPSSPKLGANKIIEQFEKLAEEERLKTLKKETLLKKRRNSLTLEKDVLKKKINKTQEKKNTVKKFLGKDEAASTEDRHRVEERLEQVNRELKTIEKDLLDNKKIEAQALDTINVMKTKTVRKHSFAKSSSNRIQVEQKRNEFKNSPSESTSSQGSAEDKSDREVPRTQETLEAVRRQSTAVSLAVLEKELRKISPVGGRKIGGGEPFRHGRVSWSSEGSQEDSGLKDSPIFAKKQFLEKKISVSSEGAPGDQSFSRPNLADSAELRRKRFSASGSKVAFHNLSVEIPTEDEKDVEDGKTVTDRHRMSTASEPGASEITLRKLSVNSEKGLEDHRASLLNALSQIKDFEEFAAVSVGDKWNK